MTSKTIKKILDVIILTLLFVSMAATLTGNYVHEISGVCLIVLFLVHNCMNWNWYKSVFRGNYTWNRTVRTIADILLILSAITAAVSAIPVSRTVFAFMDFSGSLFASRIHIAAVYWLFILVSIHVGLHSNLINTYIKENSGKLVYVVQIAIILFGLYGLIAFFNRNIGAKLILYYVFDSTRTGATVIGFLTDYLAILTLGMLGTNLLLKRNYTITDRIFLLTSF